MAGARCLALLAAAVALTGGGGPGARPGRLEQPSPRWPRRAVSAAGGAGSARPRGALRVLDPAEAPDAELEADVGAWRELWGGALDALRREPSLNSTEEAVVAQLGAVAFLHCPVRNLGERGVSIRFFNVYSLYLQQQVRAGDTRARAR